MEHFVENDSLIPAEMDFALAAARVGFACREVARSETALVGGRLRDAAVLVGQEAQAPVQDEIVES